MVNAGSAPAAALHHRLTIQSQPHPALLQSNAAMALAEQLLALRLEQ
jgi:hypothetical protein